MSEMIPLMLVPLLVWVAVWAYLWTLDGRVKRLERELRSVETSDEDENL